MVMKGKVVMIFGSKISNAQIDLAVNLSIEKYKLKLSVKVA